MQFCVKIVNINISWTTDIHYFIVHSFFVNEIRRESDRVKNTTVRR